MVLLSQQVGSLTHFSLFLLLSICDQQNVYLFIHYANAMHLWVNYGCMVINFVYVHSNCTDMWQTHGSILDLIGNILPLNGLSPHSCILYELNFQNHFQANCLVSFDRWQILHSTQIGWQLNQIIVFTYLLIWGQVVQVRLRNKQKQ